MKTITSGFVLSLLLVLTLSNCKNYRAARSSMSDQVGNYSSNMVLIVSLNTAEQKIKMLSESNQLEEATKARKRINASNQETMNVFKEHFNFCRTFFLDPAEAKSLKDGEYDRVALLDHHGNQVKDFSFLKSDYLVAAFTHVYEDVMVRADKNQTLQQVGGTNGLPALVVMDKDYIQLSRPFPFYVRTAFNNKTKAVIKLNAKLIEHHEGRRRKIYRNRRVSLSN